MAFRYRKSIDGDSISPVKDFTLDTTYATTAAKGDLVRLNGSGQLVLAATGDTNVLGVLEGFNFEGITATKPVTGKVRTAPNAIYEAEYVGAGALTVGTAYGIDGASKLDTADTTTLIAKIVEVVNGKPYVVITARQLV
jgi:hypothetical protein